MPALVARAASGHIRERLPHGLSAPPRSGLVSQISSRPPWPGAFGGWWQADPRKGSVMIFLAHNMVDLAQMAKGSGLGVWEAIDALQLQAPESLP